MGNRGEEAPSLLLFMPLGFNKNCLQRFIVVDPLDVLNDRLSVHQDLWRPWEEDEDCFFSLRASLQDYGMFVLDEETQNFWLNFMADSLSEFKLVGWIFGLAVYNTTLLDAHLPPIVYKKLNLQTHEEMGLEVRLFHHTHF